MPSGTTYEKIYNKFAASITDYSLYELLQSDEPQVQEFVDNMLLGYLTSAIAKFYKCTKDLSDRDDDMKSFHIVLDDIEIEILGLMMVNEWIEPQLNSTLYTNQFIGGSTEKFYAQSSQLGQLRALEERSRNKTRKMIRDYTYQTSMDKLG